MYEKSDISDRGYDFQERKFDRLSSLMSNFEMNVHPVDEGEGNIAIYPNEAGRSSRTLEFWPLGRTNRAGSLLEMRAEWGGQANPLVNALPRKLELLVDEDEQVELLTKMLISEAAAARCGSDGALSRLCEVLIIHILRREIALGSAAPGLISGLSDQRLSKAIVAMHNEPGKSWSNQELAEVSHLSLSRFSEIFPAKVGLSPQSYLRKWRLTLARRHMQAGQQVQSVARKLGYSSGEALTRAFKREFGAAPRYERAGAI